MEFKYFLKNDQTCPIEQAVIPLSNIEYSYGFGVYETIRVINGTAYFLNDHLDRLFESAKIIDLDHSFNKETARKGLLDLISKAESDSYNIKVLLIGGPSKEQASLFALCFNPLFPQKKVYKEGVELITKNFERIFPQAKTLNMLQSFLAYREARKVEAYDALLVNRRGCITEGTRTNFFCIKDQVIYSPPEKDILLGITRKALLHVAKGNGYEIEMKEINIEDVSEYDGAFISSTSSKIIPIKSIDGRLLPVASESLRKLMGQFDDFLSGCQGKM
jgi:branched-subunit amino acid aminotransferase/4-amino-4-deoxychorismate lyase